MLTIDESPPSVGERYISATQSSNLRLAEGRCDADYLIAAGWVADTLGARLFRLISEYETVRNTFSPAQPNRHEILRRMKGLPACRQALYDWSLTKAIVVIDRSPHVLMTVLARVLEAWLDKTCSACDGRGFNQGGRHEHTGPPIMCRPCRGSGHRLDTLGGDDDVRFFVSYLLAEMDRLVADLQWQMRRKLKN